MVNTHWRVKRLGSVATLQRGFDLPHRLRKPGIVPIVTSSGIEDFHCEARVKAPGVVTGRYGTIGEVFFVRQEFWPLNTTLYVRDFHENDPLFVSYLLRTIDFHTHSGKSGVPGVNRNDLHEIDVTLPPTKAEQETIAAALSDADALIESLEQLLAKKRQIKQGTMQQLLTGKKRLPGFETKPGYRQTEVGVIPEDWEVKILPDACRFRGGKAHEQHISDSGQFVCVNSKFISTDGSVRKYSTANFCSAKRNDILMVMSDLPNGRALAKAFLVDQENLYAVNQRVCALTPYRDCPKYLFYVLNRNPYFLKFDDGINQTHLLNHVFQKCLLPLPPTLAEQTAIATSLSDMDEEIAALETKLAKARQLKQGMMQELLTGRIRLV